MNLKGLGLPSMKELLPLGIAVIAQPTIDSYVNSYVPQQNIFGISLVDIVEVIGAGYIAIKQKGMIGQTAKWYMYLSIADVVRRVMGTGFQLLSPQGMTNDIIG